MFDHFRFFRIRIFIRYFRLSLFSAFAIFGFLYSRLSLFSAFSIFVSRYFRQSLFSAIAILRNRYFFFRCCWSEPVCVCVQYDIIGRHLEFILSIIIIIIIIM